MNNDPLLPLMTMWDEERKEEEEEEEEEEEKADNKDGEDINHVILPSFCPSACRMSYSVLLTHSLPISLAPCCVCPLDTESESLH